MVSDMKCNHSGIGLVWVWFGSGLGLVWVWFGSGLGLVRVWFEYELSLSWVTEIWP